jgi:lysophospholipase L1-like esterase
VFGVFVALSGFIRAETEAPIVPGPAIRMASTNTAAIPTFRLEDDFYDWEERHEKILEIQKSLDPEIVLIGDSITHLWGGLPVDSHARGANAWSKTFGNRRVLNLGFGWDRTQNVLWRLEHGEMDGTNPKVVVINIGTNNLTTSNHARANTPTEIADAILLICERVYRKSPKSRIIVMGVFPRGFKPDDYYRTQVIELNGFLAKRLAGQSQITFLNISDQFVAPGAELSHDLMSDGVHPTEAGYEIWGKALLAAGIFK